MRSFNPKHGDPLIFFQRPFLRARAPCFPQDLHGPRRFGIDPLQNQRLLPDHRIGIGGMRLWRKEKLQNLERKQFLLKQFEKHNITNFEFIETYDVNDGDITENELKLFESDVTHGMKSLILKHIRVYKEISQKYDYALILEDDVIFNENFTELLKKTL